MSRTSWMLALVVGCGGDPHEDFVTPTGAVEELSTLDAEGPHDNLVLNPNFTLPRFVNGVGVSTFGWDLVHDVDTPTGQPALEGYETTSLLFRLVRKPMTASIWISGVPAFESDTEVVVTFTDVDTLEDREVEAAPVEERLVGMRRWTRYSADVPSGEGLGLLVVSPRGDDRPRISGPVVRPSESEGMLRSSGVPSRPADERWRALYPTHRPTEFTLVPRSQPRSSSR